MATLTYDPTEAQEGEFSEEEQESIKVGEALEEQQQQLMVPFLMINFLMVI